MRNTIMKFSVIEFILGVCMPWRCPSFLSVSQSTYHFYYFKSFALFLIDSYFMEYNVMFVYVGILRNDQIRLISIFLT